MGERLRRIAITTFGLLLAGSLLAACTVSFSAGALGAVLSTLAFGALLAGVSTGTAGCTADESDPIDTGIGPCLSAQVTDTRVSWS